MYWGPLSPCPFCEFLGLSSSCPVLLKQLLGYLLCVLWQFISPNHFQPEKYPVHTFLWNLKITLLAQTPRALGANLCIHVLHAIICHVYSNVLTCIRNVTMPSSHPPFSYIFRCNITLSFRIDNIRISFLMNNCMF